MSIFGSDVSHYDAPDTRRMFADGIVFQTHKAGGDRDDPELGQWWTYVRGYRSKVLLGAYWVVRPDRSGSMASKADAFIDRLDSQCPGWRDGPFILQADCEIWNGDRSTLPTVAEVNAFGDRLKQRMPRLRMIAYMPDWCYGNLSALRHPLWSSKYVDGTGGYRSLYPGDGSSKWAPYGGTGAPAVLQYSSKATIGGQTTCDANAYRGTLAQLTALLAPGWASASTPAKEDDMPISDADAKKIASEVWGYMLTRPDGPDSKGNKQTSAGAYQAYSDVQANSAASKVIATLTPLIKGQGDVDEQAIASAVLAGLAPAALTDAVSSALAALPAETAKQTVDEIAARFAGNP